MSPFWVKKGVSAQLGSSVYAKIKPQSAHGPTRNGVSARFFMIRRLTYPGHLNPDRLQRRSARSVYDDGTGVDPEDGEFYEITAVVIEDETFSRRLRRRTRAATP